MYDTADFEASAQMYTMPVNLQAMQVSDIASGASEKMKRKTVRSTACGDVPSYDMCKYRNRSNVQAIALIFLCCTASWCAQYHCRSAVRRGKRHP